MTDVRVVTTEAAITGETEVRSMTVFTFSGTVTASGGGSGAVDSVNSQTGTVVLDAADVGALPDTTVIPDSPGDIGAATAAQGALADSAVQPGDLSPVATSGDYDDLSGAPALGTAAAANTGDFDPAGAASSARTAAEGYTDSAITSEVSRADAAYATAAQGATADTAVQPGDLSTVATTGAYADLSGKPTIPSTASDVGAPPTTRTVSAGTGLTGGGDLSANRTLAADFGTAAGKVTQGNDSRLSDARTPTAHASSHAAAGSDPVTLGAAQIGSGTVATARLGSGTASSSTFLRGDQTWATPAGGSGSVATDTIFDAKGDLAVGTGSDTAAKLTIGSAGQLLTPDSTQTTGLKWQDRLRNVDDPNDPGWASPLTYDVEFDTDTTSLPSGWSWVNQGTATYAATFGAGLITVPGQSGDAVRGIFRSIPSESSWTATTKAAFGGVSSNSYVYGLALRESSSGKIFLLGPRVGLTFAVWYFTDASTFNSRPVSDTTIVEMYRYVRLKKNSSSSWDALGSVDGIAWHVITSALNVSSFMTPDQLGIALYRNGAVSNSAAFHWLRVR